MNSQLNYSAPPLGSTVFCLQGPISPAQPAALPCGLVIQVAQGSPAKVVPRVGIQFDPAETLYAFANPQGGPGNAYEGATGWGAPASTPPGPQSWILSTSPLGGNGSPALFSWQGNPLIIPYINGGFKWGDGGGSKTARIGNVIYLPPGEVLILVMGGPHPVLEGLCMYSWAVNKFNVQAM